MSFRINILYGFLNELQAVRLCKRELILSLANITCGGPKLHGIKLTPLKLLPKIMENVGFPALYKIDPQLHVFYVLSRIHIFS